MITSKLMVNVEVKHVWFLKLINLPIVLFGFKPIVPSFCLRVGDTFIKKSEITGL